MDMEQINRLRAEGLTWAVIAERTGHSRDTIKKHIHREKKKAMIMKPNERLLDQFRGPGNCEVCGIWCLGRDAHHAFERGVNSWKRIDLPWNLISLGTMFPGPETKQCKCHARYHAGIIKRGQILEVIAKREGLTVEWIINEHTRLLLTGGKGGRSE